MSGGSRQRAREPNGRLLGGLRTPKGLVASLLVGGALIAAAIVWLAVRGGGNPASPSAPPPDQPSAPATSFPPGAGGDTPGASPAPVIAVTDRRGQRIQGWGTSVLGTGQSDPIVSGSGLSTSQLDGLDRLVFRKAGINLVRVLPQGGPAAPVTGPAAWSSSDQRLRFMRRVRRFGVRFMFTGGGAPLSMRAASSPTGPLLAGQEGAYARFLANSLEVAQRAGAPFTWAAIGNEVDNQGNYWVAMQPEQAARVYRDLAREIRSRGLRTRLVLGDNESWAATNEYSNLEWQQPAVRSLASVVASHGYGTVGPSVVRPVTVFARRRGLAPWMTEWVTGCTADPSDAAAQLTIAIQWANRITSDLTIGDVQAWFMLQAVPPASHGASCGIAVRKFGDPRHPYVVNKRYWMLRQFTSVAQPGAHRYDVATDAGDLGAVAFRRGRATGLVVTNPGSVARAVRVVLGHRGALSVRTTSATDNFRLVRESSYDGGELEQVLPPESVTTFRLVAR